MMQQLGGQCSWGKIPIDLLCSSLDTVTLSLGCAVKLTSEISMSPGFIEGSYELRASIGAQEAGARDMNSPYSSYSYDKVPLPSLPDIIR